MKKTTKTRDILKNDWVKMIDGGRMPIIEHPVKDGYIIVNFWLDEYGVFFNWYLTDIEGFDFGEVAPYFDGAIKKRGEGYVLSFAEIDRMGYRLDNVFTIIWENVSDGILSAYDLYENS